MGHVGVRDSVFDSEGKEHFAREGWAVARATVPADNVQRAIDAICAFHAIALDDPMTWYRVPPEAWDIVPVHHAQAFWDNRSLPRVHRAFAEVLGTEALWVSMDRGGFKPPAWGHPDSDRVAAIHWDAKPRQRIRDTVPRLQGMIFLTDTTPEAGPFECVPSLYRSAATWLAEHPDPRDNEPVVGDHPVVRVAGKAGDLVIWNALLPHRGGRNDGPAARVTQYVSMRPAGSEEEAAERVALWRERRVPPWCRSFPPTVIDPEPGDGPAHLDGLGRKLLGIDSW
jgi:hypothetical protein